MNVPGKRGHLWQRGYCEHVIRNEKALDRIRAYIANNPARWADDPENISRGVCRSISAFTRVFDALGRV